MGKTALSDHQLGKTHIENVKKICNFFSMCSKCVMAVCSNNFSRAMSALCPVMFPDSSSAAKYQLRPDELPYSVNFGLGPFFKGKLMHDVQNSNYYSFKFR